MRLWFLVGIILGFFRILYYWLCLYWVRMGRLGFLMNVRDYRRDLGYGRLGVRVVGLELVKLCEGLEY